MQKTRVAVLRGGPSSEYDVSLQSGGAVLANLPEHYEGIDILIDKSGTWHMDGMPRRVDQVLERVDVVFNAMHGEYGEDGQVQKILETFNKPFTGSRAMPSAHAMHKVLAKQAFKRAGLNIARDMVVTRGDDVENQIFNVFRSLPLPVVIKPVGAGSSVGVVIAKDFQTLHNAARDVLSNWNEVLIEEVIPGTEITCGVIEAFRGDDIYTLLPVEIVPPQEKDFFDYEAKYTGITNEICPARITPETSRAVQEAARIAHEAIGARHYSRSDFILTPKNELYILELNTQPGLTEESLLPKPLKAIGCSLGQFCGHVITRALNR